MPPLENADKPVKTNRKIILSGKNGQAHALLVDLSAQHAGVISQRGAKEGTELELIFEIPAFKQFVTLALSAVVSHRHRAKEGVYLKFSFTRNTPEEQAALEDFLAYKHRLLEMGRQQAHPHESLE
ncbi:MAG: PilZ domain-containing protein [Gammaproteobacteria bacterium]|nr:PilZ domain-containing protein [Gammaproteobacteria bacterium]